MAGAPHPEPGTSLSPSPSPSPSRASGLHPVAEQGEHDVPLRHRVIHGYRRAYRMAGSGPAILLIHGIGDSSATWADLIPELARNHTVIAPDLLGHGASDKPRADYSVAAYANGIRDLLGVLGIERATLVGHSLGGEWPCSSPTSTPSAPTA